MKLSRRTLLKSALGVSQLALLDRFGLSSARANPPAHRPTKLLAIWLDGGCHFETFFAPLSTAGIQKFIPSPSGGLIPLGYAPGQVQNFDGSAVDLDAPGPSRKLRGPIYFNPMDPTDASGTNPLSGGNQRYRPWGYIWANPNYALYEKASLLVGADQNTASHLSGVVASMCGVAGASFRAPAVQAIIGHAMATRFPDRPLPSIVLGGRTPAPVALGLPSLANPTKISTLSAVESTMSDLRDSAWSGLRARNDIPNVDLRGNPLQGTVPVTAVDAAVLRAVQRQTQRTTTGSDAMLGQLYDMYKAGSKTIARDVLSVIQNTVGFEHLNQDPLYPRNWTACIGYADSCGPSDSLGDFDFALRLLKSDLATSVTMRATSIDNYGFDTHIADGPRIHTNHLHISLEMVGRMIAEMSLTPSSGGRTLLDDTLVYVFSDFGRTFPKQGSDHHPATCAILAGGGITGNQMLGGYNEAMNGSPMGGLASLIEEDGSTNMRAPRSQDVAATVLSAFGLQGGRDFFIPGGYGVFSGLVPG
jgi:hypothetical protein